MVNGQHPCSTFASIKREVGLPCGDDDDEAAAVFRCYDDDANNKSAIDYINSTFARAPPVVAADLPSPTAASQATPPTVGSLAARHGAFPTPSEVKGHRRVHTLYPVDGDGDSLGQARPAPTFNLDATAPSIVYAPLPLCAAPALATPLPLTMPSRSPQEIVQSELYNIFLKLQQSG